MNNNEFNKLVINIIAVVLALVVYIVVTSVCFLMIGDSMSETSAAYISLLSGLAVAWIVADFFKRKISGRGRRLAERYRRVQL